MNLDEVSAYVSAINRRNGAIEGAFLVLAPAYGAKLSATQRDEILTCRRIARSKAERAKRRGAACV